MNIYNVDNISTIYKNTLDFIKKNINEDVNKLVFNKSKIISNTDNIYINKDKKFNEIEFNFAIEQIFMRQRFAKKFPNLHKNYDFIFTNRINCEQASSEHTANYKANIIKNYNTSLDLTGGLGIDSLFFAKYSKQHCYCERDLALCNYFKINTNNLNYNNICINNTSSEAFLDNNRDIKYDIVYIDPDRRNKDKRYFLLNQLSPNILTIKDALLNIGENVIIKLSPLFDISQVKTLLSNIQGIHVISVENECKELLVVLSNKARTDEIKYYAVNLFNDNNRDTINDISEQEIDNNLAITYSFVQKYIYEPNSSLMKIGSWGMICKKYNVSKLHINSHLFTSNEVVSNFPGRKFEVIGVENLNSKKILPYLDKDKKVNITMRNFPIQAKEIHKKLGTKDGGNIYIFATTTIDNKHNLIITKNI